MAFFTNGTSHTPIPPLGVHMVDGGVHVAVYASAATGVEFCLLDPVPGSPQTFTERRIALTTHAYGVWHDFVPGIGEGQRYGFRTMGQWHPRAGLRYNPTKLLVDPYARSITGELSYVSQVYGYDRPDPISGEDLNGRPLTGPGEAAATEDGASPVHALGSANALETDAAIALDIDGQRAIDRHSSGPRDPESAGATEPESLVPLDPYGPADSRDSKDFVPHSRVVASRPPAAQNRPHVPWRDTVIYEAHLKGLTKNLDGVPKELAGTYAGAAHPVTIAHLKELGITTLELLPIHAFVSEPHLAQKGLTNYWGYNTLGFFAPHEAYATAESQAAGPGAIIDEVRGMVQLLHEAGIEVILDVVYNHTAEGGNDGPQLSFRGLDNLSYYLHDGKRPANFADVTGCGNTLDFRHPRVVQLALDSLRFWLTEIGVDGFRFDLAVTLGRDSNGYNPSHPFLVALQTDPVISQAKLIAEPWDVGLGGWQTGGFPAPFSEWNDRFRNSVRGFWLSDANAVSHGQPGSGIRELATRLAGSVDLFGHSSPPLMRGPVASINFVTAHDGFTLHDLVAYDHKHNEANGEDSRDGTNDNRSWNHGVEGNLSEDDIWQVIAPLRRRSMRNMLATLILSAGTPMITAGDEYGRTQNGNNNPYCQDNDIGWLDWNNDGWRQELFETTKYLLGLRSSIACLRAEDFFSGQPLAHDEDHQPDLAWYGTTGTKLTPDEWNDPGTRVFQMLRRSQTASGPAPSNAHVLIVANGNLSDAAVTLPQEGNSVRSWALAWDSAWENPTLERELIAGQPELNGGATIELESLNMQVYLATA